MNLQECRTRGILKTGMYPADLCEVIQQFKSPSWYTWSIEVNRWGKRMREEFGINDGHGTLWFATVLDNFDSFSEKPIDTAREGDRSRGRTNVGPVPCNEIPYAAIVTAHFNEATKRYQGGKLLRGWHTLLLDLCKQGFLYPNDALSALIGGNSWEAVPRHFWA